MPFDQKAYLRKYHRENGERLRRQRNEWYATNRNAILSRKRERYARVQREFSDWKLGRGCAFCRYAIHADALQVDHIEPVLRAGARCANRPATAEALRRLQEDPTIQVLCANCHAIKTAKEHRERALACS